MKGDVAMLLVQDVFSRFLDFKTTGSPDLMQSQDFWISKPQEVWKKSWKFWKWNIPGFSKPTDCERMKDRAKSRCLVWKDGSLFSRLFSIWKPCAVAAFWLLPRFSPPPTTTQPFQYFQQPPQPPQQPHNLFSQHPLSATHHTKIETCKMQTASEKPQRETQGCCFVGATSASHSQHSTTAHI